MAGSPPTELMLFGFSLQNIVLSPEDFSYLSLEGERTLEAVIRFIDDPSRHAEVRRFPQSDADEEKDTIVDLRKRLAVALLECNRPDLEETKGDIESYMRILDGLLVEIARAEQGGVAREAGKQTESGKDGELGCKSSSSML